MMLLDCHGKIAEQRVRHGSAIYIGRQTPAYEQSLLRNPYVSETAAKAMSRSARDHVVVVPDESVIERYKRHLTRGVIEGGSIRRALVLLGEHSMLACWCASRPAQRIGLLGVEPEHPCHGDVIYTVWLTCEDIGLWQKPPIEFTRDYRRANEAWGNLYELAFGEEMQWGGGR